MRIIFFFLLFASGCSIFDSNDEISRVEITPLYDSYTFSDTTIVELELINRTSMPVYFSSCDQHQIERLENDQTVDVFTTVSACLCICIVDIAPGDTVSFGYRLGMLNQTEYDVDSGGTYRIWPVLYETNSFQEQLPRHLIDVKGFHLAAPSL